MREKFDIEGRMTINESVRSKYIKFLEEEKFAKSSDVDLAINDSLPVVGISKPECIPIIQIIPENELSPFIQQTLFEYEYYLIKADFYLTPQYDEFKIHQARYTLIFTSPSDCESPIVYAMYPENVDINYKVSKRCTLNPNLKFLDYGLSVGEKETIIEYPELKPIIIGSGIKSNQPTWEYRSIESHEIAGNQRVHMVLKVKKANKPVKLSGYLSAKLKPYGFSVDSIIRFTEGRQEENDGDSWHRFIE